MCPILGAWKGRKGRLDRSEDEGMKMAYVTSQRAFGATAMAWFGDVVAAWANAHERRSVYTRTLRELSSLTNRELADINLSRSQIIEVSHEAAYGK